MLLVLDLDELGGSGVRDFTLFFFLLPDTRLVQQSLKASRKDEPGWVY